MLKLSAINLIRVSLVILVSTNLYAQGVITTPRVPSPAAMVSQTIGISTVTVKYSRPSVKNREIWGALVPYGYNVQAFGAGNEAPWRAGANENTVIELSDPATIEGQSIPAGSYGLFFVINKDNTGEVVLSKNYTSWGSFWYDAKEDEMRAKIQLRDIPATERLTYNFVNVTKNSAELVLDWEKKEFPVKIEFAVDSIVMANAERQLKNSVGFTWQGYASAAAYALQNKVNLDEGLKWIDQAIAQNKSFATLNVKSGILKEQGKNDESDKIEKEAFDIATETELNNYGYQLIAQNQQDKAIEIFILNTKKHP